MVPVALAQWEEEFCLPCYQGKITDINSVYLQTQKFYAECCPAGRTQQFEGLCATSCGTPWAGLNVAFLTDPIRSVDRFCFRLECARAFYASRGEPWILAVPDKWVAPDQRALLHTGLQKWGFQLAMDAYAIEAESVEPPVPHGLQIICANEAKWWPLLAELNACAWSVPVEWVKPLFDSPRFQEEAHGYIGFEGDTPVGAVVEFPAGRYNFLAWGATVPEFRRKGYGALLLRQACVASAPGRTLLGIQSPQGLHTRLQCGFTQGERFRLYLAPAKQSP